MEPFRWKCESDDMRRVGLSVLFAIVFVGVVLLGVRWSRVPRSAEDAMKRFYDTSGKAETDFMDPLILAGPMVVPLLAHDVESKDMRGRRYGLLALGHIGDRRGYGVLKRILDDPTETPYIRRDALESIDLIDPTVGRQEAIRYRTSPVPDLAEYSGAILAGHIPRRRTFMSTLIGISN
jgi:hypothetical protein